MNSIEYERRLRRDIKVTQEIIDSLLRADKSPELIEYYITQEKELKQRLEDELTK